MPANLMAANIPHRLDDLLEGFIRHTPAEFQLQLPFGAGAMKRYGHISDPPPFDEATFTPLPGYCGWMSGNGDTRDRNLLGGAASRFGRQPYLHSPTSARVVERIPGVACRHPALPVALMTGGNLRASHP